MTIRDRLTRAGEVWDFELTFEAIREKRLQKNDARKFILAASVFAGITLGAAILGVYGMWVGNFSVVSSFWGAMGPIFGSIIGYYFGKNGDTS